MNELIKQQVCDVLGKYDKYYNIYAVEDNLQSWQNNKGWLVELLRHHPNWNEDALAVVFEITHSREIDRATVNLYRYELGQLINELDMTEDDKNKFTWSLDAVAFTYAKILPGADTAVVVKNYCGVTCSVGQKTSRIINAICRKYGLDKHPEYNARFAKLADSLNPMQIRRTALLSVHPCDYLEMSNRNNSWSSCHCLDDGEYHGGTLSYMNDECSMIFYTVDDCVTSAFYTVPKRTRQVFCFSNGILLQSRLYPQQDDDETRDIYRNIVQRTFADCLAVPNLWTLKREHDEVVRRVRTHADALNYRDYEYKCYKPNISLLKSANVSDDDYICVGNTAYCIDCSEANYENNSLYCESCSDDGYISCSDCNRRVHEEDAHYIDGRWYCGDCCSYCDHCEEYTHSETTEVRDSRNYAMYVCRHCLVYYRCCEDCAEYHNGDDGHFIDGGFYCYSCVEANYRTCDGCSEYTHNDDIEEIDGKYYCASCADDFRFDSEVAEDESECLEDIQTETEKTADYRSIA